MNTKKKKKIGEWALIAVFLTPWLIDIILFKLFPFLYGIFISFFKISYKESTFVGLENYINSFKQKIFWDSLLATLKICMVTIPVIVIGALLISLLLKNCSKRIKGIIKVILYLPAVTSEIVLAIVWKNMFSTSYGLSATICNYFGIQPIEWLTDEKLAVVLVGLLVSGICIAQPVVLISNSIDNVNKSIVEAAELDGATGIKKLIYITLPQIKPTISFVLITTTIANLQVFYVPYLLTGGGPENKTLTALYLIYKNAFEYGNYGLADAQGMILFLIIGAMVLVQYKLTKAGKFNE